jgi:anthranilate phosphoribosyltransferase
MKHVAPIRSQLPFRTIFNLLGPLTNPAGAEYQLLGACSIEIALKLAGALAELGRRHALVVCGAGELDEVSLWGETTVFEVAGSNIREHRWTAATFDLAECAVTPLRVRSPAESADVIRGVLSGQRGSARDIVIANSAAALLAAQRTDDPRAAAREAQTAIDSGSAQAIYQRLVEWTTAAR